MDKPIFQFVNDDRLRELLVDYYEQALRSLEAECCLGALTGCGGVLEGLLTWRLLQRQSDAEKAKKAQRRKDGTVLPLPDWGLASLVAVAKELKMIGDTAESACWAVKEFRNLIHPYNTLKKGSARPNRNLADGAIAAVNEVVRSLSGRLEP